MIQMILNMNPIGQVVVGLIVAILIATIVILLRVKTKYMKLTYDLLENENRKGEIFKLELNNAIVDDYKLAVKAKIKEINTPAIVDKNMSLFLSNTSMGERFVSKASGLMIVLGLVGTFFGLTLSISELVALLSNTSEAMVGDVNMITGGLLNSINGMSVAFVTSLFGISASIIVNVLTVLIGLSETRENYIAVAEEYLDNTLGDKAVDMTDVDENGKTPLELAFEKLGGELSASMEEMSSAMSYRLTAASNNMRDTADSIEKSMHQFDKSIETFSENTHDFAEFNHQLRNNIQRLSLTFDDLSESIKEQNKNK